METRNLDQLSHDIKNIVSSSFSKKSKETKYNDIILNRFIKKSDIIICHKIKVIQMKIGQIWQDVIGSIDDVINLKRGHISKLDILSHKYKFVMELKNSHNTCNSSSRTSIYNNLIEFKKEHNDYEIIFAYINCNTSKNTGKNEIISYKSYNIRILSGNKLLAYLFGNKSENVLEILSNSLQDFL